MNEMKRVKVKVQKRTVLKFKNYPIGSSPVSRDEDPVLAKNPIRGSLLNLREIFIVRKFLAPFFCFYTFGVRRPL